MLPVCLQLCREDYVSGNKGKATHDNTEHKHIRMAYCLCTVFLLKFQFQYFPIGNVVLANSLCHIANNQQSQLNIELQKNKTFKHCFKTQRFSMLSRNFKCLYHKGGLCLYCFILLSSEFNFVLKLHCIAMDVAVAIEAKCRRSQSPLSPPIQLDIL